MFVPFCGQPASRLLRPASYPLPDQIIPDVRPELRGPQDGWVDETPSSGGGFGGFLGGLFGQGSAAEAPVAAAAAVEGKAAPAQADGSLQPHPGTTVPRIFSC